MANSLRAKISKLRHDGKISDAEYQEIIKKLDGHDAMIRTDAINEYNSKIKEVCKIVGSCDFEVLDMLANELKEQGR